MIFGTLTLVTGSIWAKISWGVWWVWGDDQLVLFLVLFLFYCAYFMLRFSVDPGPPRANMCAVYALFGVVLIPISFLAIRLSKSFIHPVVFTPSGPQMAGSQFLTFCVAWLAMLALFVDALPARARGQAARQRACGSCGSSSPEPMTPSREVHGRRRTSSSSSACSRTC